MQEVKDAFSTTFPGWELIRESDKTAIFQKDGKVVKFVLLLDEIRFRIESSDGLTLYNYGVLNTMETLRKSLT